VEIGFTLSSEEQSPKDLVHLARAAEESGFSFATISDHFHPWTSQQGNSPFVWSVLGAIAGVTSRIRIWHCRHVPTDQDPSGNRGAGGRNRDRDDAGLRRNRQVPSGQPHLPVASS
jgi:Luciferase-like monooxygenase